MKTANSTNLQEKISFEPEVIFKSSLYHTKIQIVRVYEGWSQIMKEGKWVNNRWEKEEVVIVEIGKYFENEQEAIEFTEKKQFKRLIKLISKGGL